MAGIGCKARSLRSARSAVEPRAIATSHPLSTTCKAGGETGAPVYGHLKLTFVQMDSAETFQATISAGPRDAQQQQAAALITQRRGVAPTGLRILDRLNQVRYQLPGYTGVRRSRQVASWFGSPLLTGRASVARQHYRPCRLDSMS